MTLEEAKISASQGDLESILALGSYYFGEEGKDEDRDINEAIKWYEKGAELGYPRCMYLASILLDINGHAILSIAGASGANDALRHLDRALFWANKANENHFPDAEKQIIAIKGEIGIANFRYAFGDDFTHPTQQESIERYTKAITILKEVYPCTENKEVYYYLALALDSYGELTGYTNENNKLEFMLFHKCVDDYSGEKPHSDVAAFYLGKMYSDGRGWPVDYDKSHFYFQKAQDAGIDCSEILKHFKKKLFGGYTLV